MKHLRSNGIMQWRYLFPLAIRLQFKASTITAIAVHTGLHYSIRFNSHPTSNEVETSATECACMRSGGGAWHVTSVCMMSPLVVLSLVRTTTSQATRLSQVLMCNVVKRWGGCRSVVELCIFCMRNANNSGDISHQCCIGSVQVRRGTRVGIGNTSRSSCTGQELCSGSGWAGHDGRDTYLCCLVLARNIAMTTSAPAASIAAMNDRLDCPVV